MQSPMKLEISLYPFFCGRNFTSSYEYTDLSVNSALNAGSEFTITLNVKNTGSCEGIEVAQLKLKNNPVSDQMDKQLQKFEKISLKPGESKNIKFTLNLFDVLRRMGLRNKELEVIAGHLSRRFSLKV